MARSAGGADNLGRGIHIAESSSESVCRSAKASVDATVKWSAAMGPRIGAALRELFARNLKGAREVQSGSFVASVSEFSA